MYREGLPMADRKIRVAMVGRYPKEAGKPLGGPEAVGEVLADSLALSGEVDIDFITSVEGLKEYRPALPLPESRSICFRSMAGTSA